MQAYQINELERLTGIKAHTIRIWEKRYNLITPSRTDTNRRYYSDTQVRKLLNVTTLLSQGHKISKIATYSEKEINNYVANNIVVQTDEDKCTAYINDLVKSMLIFDEPVFEEVFHNALKQFGVYETVINVVYPLLHKTGILWAVNKAAPVQEHFASSIIRRKLMAVTDSLPQVTEKKSRFLLFLPPNEWHEIGLLFANYIIRSNGYETVYLGQNVPLDNINKITKALEPAYLLFFYVAPRPKAEIDKQITELAKSHKQTGILVAGHADLLPEKRPALKNVKYLSDVNDLMSFF